MKNIEIYILNDSSTDLKKLEWSLEYAFQFSNKFESKSINHILSNEQIEMNGPSLIINAKAVVAPNFFIELENHLNYKVIIAKAIAAKDYDEPDADKKTIEACESIDRFFGAESKLDKDKNPILNTVYINASKSLVVEDLITSLGILSFARKNALKILYNEKLKVYSYYWQQSFKEPILTSKSMMWFVGKKSIFLNNEKKVVLS